MPLFDEEEIHEDLHLMVTESPDESQIVVYGEMYVTFTVIFTGVINRKYFSCNQTPMYFCSQACSHLLLIRALVFICYLVP